MRISWHVVHTQPLKEILAGQHLLDQGYEVYMPRFKKTVRHARKVEEKLVPLFPRYIFVGMDLTTARWHNINGTRGVSYLLVHEGCVPSEVPLEMIEDLRSRETAQGVVSLSALVHFARGERVRILEGALQDQVAIVESFSDADRVQLLLNFMGRVTRVRISLSSVEAA